VQDGGHDRILRRAFDAQAETFNRSAVANDARILDEMVSLGAPRRTERWLDAACGPGIVSRRLASLAGAVLGIDLTPAMVDVARREAAAAGIENATFEVGDATATGHAGDSFDGAMTRFSIHHLPAPGRLLDELARVVRPGGRIVVVDHLADDDADAASWSQEIERLRDPSHWACLTATRLRALGETAGLALDDERRLPFELDLDDWIRRGAADAGARALVERLLTERPPTAARCFGVQERGGQRVLTLRLWLGRWRRPDDG
jgi:SAM-dependent methyltransferase